MVDFLYDEEIIASHSANMMLSHLNASKSADGDWGAIPDRAFESTLDFFAPGEASGDDMAFDYSVDFSDYLLDTVVEGLSN